jgi:hypothetical protein
MGNLDWTLRTSLRKLDSLMEQSDGPVRQTHLASSCNCSNQERSCGRVDEDVLGFHESYQIAISMAILLGSMKVGGDPDVREFNQLSNFFLTWLPLTAIMPTHPYNEPFSLRVSQHQRSESNISLISLKLPQPIP